MPIKNTALSIVTVYMVLLYNTPDQIGWLIRGSTPLYTGLVKLSGASVSEPNRSAPRSTAKHSYRS